MKKILITLLAVAALGAQANPFEMRDCRRFPVEIEDQDHRFMFGTVMTYCPNWENINTSYILYCTGGPGNFLCVHGNYLREVADKKLRVCSINPRKYATIFCGPERGPDR